MSERRPADVWTGVLIGLLFAGGFAGIATIILGFRAILGGFPLPDVVETWVTAVAFYLVSGALGGAVYGALRPIQHRRLGQLVTAYLILLLVYGGGTVALWPTMQQEGTTGSLRTLLAVWAVLAAILAPIYVHVIKNS
jgi:hypothetical protein